MKKIFFFEIHPFVFDWISLKFLDSSYEIRSDDPFDLRSSVVRPGLFDCKIQCVESAASRIGFNIATYAVPTTEKSCADIPAVNRPEETKVVGRLAPFQRTKLRTSSTMNSNKYAGNLL
jgi:hypothetical protein